MQFSVFIHSIKAQVFPNAYIGYSRRYFIMHKSRDLAKNVWYGVATAINIGEPLFHQDWATVIFYRVLLDATKRFDFEMRGLVLSRCDRWFRHGGFLRPHRGEVFKQRHKHNKRVCLFRAVLWVG
jgi:hypothetical protein